MNKKQQGTKNTVIFIGLTIAGIAVALSSQLVVSPLDQMIMVAFGSAIFGAGLTFFLLQMSSILEK
jgi:hypothetical protein